MFKHFIANALATACLLSAAAQNKPNPNRYSVNLNEVKEDKVTVEFYPQKQTAKSVDFMLPRMVPGTYAIYDFSRFVGKVMAFNEKGKKLKVVQSKDGQFWTIKKANKLSKISYEVEDTWDTDKQNVIFEPAGTNFDPVNNVFVLNTHGVFGYLAGRELDPVQIEVIHPQSLYGSCSLDKINTNTTTDTYKADNYHDLVDAPMMYAAPDTASFEVGNANVLIHTYSPTGAVKSIDLLKDIQPIVTQQVKYLGDVMPVSKYVFIIYLNKEAQGYLSGAAGALEHGRSSLYTLFEGESSAIAGTIRDVAAHEFFHIVTPLFIHSEEIGDFNYSQPKMSRHLWLYEGYTEYCAQHMQTFQQLKTNEEFLEAMSDKLRNSKLMNDDISFTALSLGALDDYKSQYGNVYLKGALLCMAFDMYLIQNSQGQYDMKTLLKDLSALYGKNKSFKDDELFTVIDKLVLESKTFKATVSPKQWLETYIAGTTKIDYATLLAPFGVLYEKEGVVKEVSKFGFSDLQGGLDFDFKKQLLKVKSEKALDEFGSKDLGLKANDLLQSWNGNELTIKTANAVLGAHDGGAKKGDKLSIGVLRLNAAGEYEPITLLATIREVESVKKHVFSQIPNPDASQQKLKKAWLNNLN